MILIFKKSQIRRKKNEAGNYIIKNILMLWLLINEKFKLKLAQRHK